MSSSGPTGVRPAGPLARACKSIQRWEDDGQARPAAVDEGA